MTDDKCGSTRGHEYLHTEMMTTLDKSVYSFIVRMRLMKITFLTSIFKDKRIRLNYRGGEATTETMSERSSGNGGGATCFLAQGTSKQLPMNFYLLLENLNILFLIIFN